MNFNKNNLVPVRFDRQQVNESFEGKLEVGDIDKGNIVLAVKFSNIGVNSKVGVGDKNGMEWINANGGPEISMGTGHPFCVEDEFTFKFEKIDTGISDADTTHCCLVTYTVLKC